MLRYIKCAFPNQTAHFVRYYQRQIFLYTWKLYIGAEGREFEHRRGSAGDSLCQPSSKWVPFFESGKDKAPKDRNELCVP